MLQISEKGGKQSFFNINFYSYYGKRYLQNNKKNQL